MECNFSYSAPTVLYKNITMKLYSDSTLQPAPTGMNLLLVKKLLQHKDMSYFLKTNPQKMDNRLCLLSIMMWKK